MAVWSRLVSYTRKHPVVRGILSYAAIWPTSCIIQQTIAAPTLYGWVRISTHLWPHTTLRTALTKAVVEQFTYGPMAMCCFFFTMNYLKTNSVQEATDEVKQKFWPTYKVAICVWPVLQTINFLYIKERNRVPFVSVCSLIWCCFLAYMHELQTKQTLRQLM
ncbi:hypothetical protein Trydic_g17741 [Trypoxylus dichotomus]